MKLVEVRVTKAHSGLAVGEIVRVVPFASTALVSRGLAELVGAAPVTESMGEPAAVSAGTDESPPKPQEVAVEFKPAASFDEAVAKLPRKRPAKNVEAEDEKDSEPKPKRARKGTYRRRDVRPEP